MFDLSIIGGGPGGYETALAAAEKGLKVALYSDALGGTCLNEGCIPTKALAHSAAVALGVQEAASSGIKVEFQGIDFKAIMARKDAIVAGLIEGLTARIAGNENITVFPRRISLSQIEPSRKVIIASGSVNAVLPIEGAELCLSSRDILSLETLPESLCIIGGGVIGIEIASILSAFGVKVTVVEYCKEILPFFDDELARRLRRSLSSRGVEFVLGAKVVGVEKGVDTVERDCPQLVVHYSDKKEKEQSVEAEKVLMAVGRRAAVDGLELEEDGIAYSRKGIETDEYQRVRLVGGGVSERIYAIGDICGGKMLAHAATAQGKTALAHILGQECKVKMDICPAAVFTSPPLASVGRSDASGEGVKVIKTLYRSNGKAQCLGETEGLCKILVGEDDTILGATILGAEADLLIQQIADVMALGGRYSQMKQIIHIHPTLSELLV